LETFNITNAMLVFALPNTIGIGIDRRCLEDIKTEMFKTENDGNLQLAAESAFHFVNSMLELEEARNREARLCPARPKLIPVI
jgi:hypothetical protein